MAQKEPTDITEASSDFLTFDRVKTPITDTVQNAEQDVRSLLADTEKIKDFISCRRCNNEFDKDSHRPLLLPCLDGICKMCILDLQTTGKTSYECAKCLTEHVFLTENVVTLQTDVTRELLSEMCRLSNEESSLVCEMCTSHQTASHRCVDCCHFICIDCVKLHEVLRQYKSHQLLGLKNLLSREIGDLGIFCSTSSKQCLVAGHEKENATLFCNNTLCKKPICIRCAITTHKDHTFCDLSDVGKESQTKVQNQMRDLRSKADEALVSVKSLTDLHEKSIEKSEELQSEIKIYFSEAKRALELREKTLLDDVTVKFKNEQRSIENEKTRLTYAANLCKEACYYGKVASEINNYPSFLDVAESIQSRINNLGDQLHKNQFIIETMKFVSEPHITSHLTILNNLGKLTVSKVLSSKSTTIISPSVCEVNQEVQFKIQLLSSLGKPVVDEYVNVCLELNGKTFTILPCIFDNLSTTYTASWIPDKRIEIAWIVVSNGIRMETLQGILDVKRRTKKAFGASRKKDWSDFARPAMYNTESEVALPPHGDLSNFGGYTYETNHHTMTQSKVLEVKTAKGLLIKIYVGSITRLDVDCVVNAANEHLMHGGGVSAVISEAAGYQFDKESQQYVEHHGPIPVGSCCVTSAGKLPYKCVIHTVGPRWSDYRDSSRCLELLQKSVEVAFMTADKEGMNSVAIPAISSGIFGVPRDKCVEQYYRAAISFCSTYPYKNLREIHFVDRDESMVKAIQGAFQ